ncbi:MAG: hypothetical protein QOJ13_507 [Gaiellales bacterium]|jgi:hypothetical protein|nr:hypothetical protein [Gaiellales bacterium]
MYTVDPTRTDLVDEFRGNPYGPYSPELTLLVNRLRLGPMEERYILVCTRRGREWAVAKMPTVRGARLSFVEGAVFDDYAAAIWEVFRLRWQAVTGEALDS